MKYVNCYSLDEVLSLLERIETIKGVHFEEFDVDDEDNIRNLVDAYVRPAVDRAPAELRDELRHAFEYYSCVDTALFERLRASHQELSLPDPISWRDFLRRMGVALFGSEFSSSAGIHEYKEVLDQRIGRPSRL